MNTHQINRAGRFLVSYELAKAGFAVILSSDRDTALVATRPGSALQLLLDVRATSGPVPAGGKGTPELSWWASDRPDTEFVALAELSSDAVWLFRAEEFARLAQQHSGGQHHLYMRLDPDKPARRGMASLRSEFDEYLIEARTDLLTSEVGEARGEQVAASDREAGRDPTMRGGSQLR